MMSAMRWLRFATMAGAMALAPWPAMAQDDATTPTTTTSATSGRSSARPAAAVVPFIEISGSIAEYAEPLNLFGAPPQTLRDLTGRIDRARTDESVRGMVVQLISPGWGWAQMMELQQSLADFRASGKPLYIYTDSLSMSSYVLASAGTEIVVSPLSIVQLYGMDLGVYYVSDMLGKLGIEAQAVNTGPYKDAFDPFTRQSMSPGTREQYSALLDDFIGTMTRTVATNRGVSEDEAREMLLGGPYSAEEALHKGVVDRLANLHDLKQLVRDEIGGNVTMPEDYGKKAPPKPPSLMSILSGTAFSRRGKSTTDKIAVVYAVGPIIDGRNSDTNPFASTAMVASDDFIDLLDEVLEEGGVKALVLRVDSPGGSAVASDRIWSRLQQIRAEGIPVIASMGNAAASGGYYISMGADTIVAQPTTLTGSIGVVGGRFAIGETFEKVGITRESISVGDNADMFTEVELWNKEQQALMERQLEGIYEVFTAKAAQGRGMEQDRVKAIGGGRVWSGAAALQNGLVDEIGGLDRAIAIAREKANAPNAEVVAYPKELTLFELINKLASGDVQVTAPVSRTAALRQSSLYQAASLMLPSGPLDRMLFVVESMSDRPTAILMAPMMFEIGE